MDTYFPYHIHTELSLLDSCTNYKEYVDLCKQHNIKAIAFSEHGNIMNWYEKKQYCDQNNIKFVFACEVYLTETLNEKIRDNYHTVLIAKNNDGVSELMSLISIADDDLHKYYKPRITFDEFLNISDNIISTSACLASPLAQLDKANPYYEKLINKYTFLEIQPHDYQDQRDYNMYLYELSKKYNKPLILGTDTHSSTQYKAECRKILKTAKKMIYADEDSFDLTFQTVDTLIKKYQQQKNKENLIPYDAYMEAINNTNILNNTIKEVSFDTSFKYPNLYKNEDGIFKETVAKLYQEKINKGVINANNEKYLKNIQIEYEVFKKLGMLSFMLFMSELVRWCHDNDIPTGFCRGSVGGSTIAYILDIIDVDPVKWNTIFSRFANEDRVSLGDIDLDFKPSDREKVYEYIINRFGKEYTCYILTTGTIADKGTIDEIARALTILNENDDNIINKYNINNTKNIKAEFERIQQEYTDIYNKITGKEKKILDFLKHDKFLKELEDESDIDKFIQKYNEFLNLKEKYKELFYYFDGLKGTVISKGMHPAGIVASPLMLANNIGLMYTDGKAISQINMDELHDLNYVKYDILGLKNIGIIKDTYRLINCHYLQSHEINWEDQKVWNDIIKSPVGVFQFEGNYSFDLLKRYISRKIKNNEKLKINDLSLVNASLRPSGKSYRDRLIQGEYNNNPSKEIDELLKDNNGFLVFQEDTLKFLMNICGFSGSHADNVRRAIGGKKLDVLEKELPKILDGYCEYANKERNIAEKEAKQFIQILSDSAEYQFGYNHSTGYSMIGYNCAMLRYYYPLEFTTSYLNNADNEKDIIMGTELAKQLNIQIKPPKFRYSSGQYMPDKNNNTIYKGIGSIKFCNEKIGEELYNLKDNKYNTFLDVIEDIFNNTSINNRQFEILIRLNYFSEFGKSKRLLSILNIYNQISNKKQFNKNKIQLPLTEDLIRKHSNKETEKIFKEVDISGIINELIINISDEDFSIQDIFKSELEYLGYISYINKDYDNNVVVVSDINKNRYGTPFADLYRLNNGVCINLKIDKKYFDSKPLSQYDLICINNIKEKSKRRKIDGKWVILDEKEYILDNYSMVVK